MKEEFRVKKNGYVHEDGKVTDEQTISTHDNEPNAVKALFDIPMDERDDYYIDRYEWVLVSGSVYDWYSDSDYGGKGASFFDRNQDTVKFETAFNLCQSDKWTETHGAFRVKGGRVNWESASYKDCDKVLISRFVNGDEGGKPSVLGLNVKSRYIDPDTKIELVNNTKTK